MPGAKDADLAEKVARELGECRHRGIERLDVRSARQQPLAVPELEALATSHAAAKGLSAQGRITQIKRLLLDALTALEDGDPTDARLIRGLFFGDDTARVRLSAGDLLKRMQKRYGEPSESRFRDIRNAAFHNFADFLIEFVTLRAQPDTAKRSDEDGPSEPGALPPGPERGWVESPLEAILQFALEDPGGTKSLTIDEHCRIIDAHGACWWAWFRSAQDADHTAQIRARLANCEIGLWERSEGLYYVAHCDAVATDNGRSIASPDPALTPGYYRSRPYPAWVRLRSIRMATGQEFAERFGYLPRAPDTIYWSPEPMSGPLTASANGNTILHLSDLRFGAHHRWRTASAPRRHMLSAEEFTAQTLLVHHVDLASIGLVVICGNFVSDEPAVAALEEALTFIDGLCSLLPGVSRKHVVIVPGADDFERPGNRERSGQGFYRDFHENLYGGEQDITRLRRYDFDSFRLNVLPVNSVKLLGTTERDEGQFGSAYDPQLHMMQQDYLLNRAQTRIINAVVAHHHLISTPVKPPETASQESVRARVMPGIHDARDVLAKLSANRIALFLHGHIHEPDCYTIISDDDWPTAVCSAGTAGASGAWLRSRYRDGHGNSLAIYTIESTWIRGRMFVRNEDSRHPSVSAREFVLRDQESLAPEFSGGT